MAGVGKCTVLEQGVVLKADVQQICVGQESTFNIFIRVINIVLENVSKSKTIPYIYLLS